MTVSQDETKSIFHCDNYDKEDKNISPGGSKIEHHIESSLLGNFNSVIKRIELLQRKACAFLQLSHFVKFQLFCSSRVKKILD